MAGVQGRFSTDLDFVASDDDLVVDVISQIDGVKIAGFHFNLHETPGGDGRHWNMTITHADLGPVDIGASVEFARRPLALPPETLPFVTQWIHRFSDIALPEPPVIGLAEACAEKLARYRRTSLGRDMYDRRWMAGERLNESLIRRLWVLKVWADINDDNRGAPPLDVTDMLRQRTESDFRDDSIGALTRPVDIPAWETRVRHRFAFLADLDDSEREWARCDRRDLYAIKRALEELGSVDR